MKLNLTLIVIFSVICLVACGGEEGSNTTPPVTPPIVTQPEDLERTIPTPIYDANSENLTSFNAINEFRASLGLSLLAQNSKLDMAAQNHVNYLVTNNIYSGHGELKGLPGFTGVDATERAAYSGYIANWVDELGAPTIGAKGVGHLINTVYHRSGLMGQAMSEVGISNSQHPKVITQWISLSDILKKQKNKLDYTAVYPVNGQKNVPLFMMAESIDPFPTIELPSSPISFISAAGTKLKVINFTVTAQDSSLPLTTQLITQENDPNPGYLPSHEAYIAGVEPFSPNTVYNVSFVGKVNGVDVSKNWSFTTGDYKMD